jgi:hypothetical protein
MKVVADVYGREPLTKEALKMFFMLLLPYDLGQIKEALQEHMRIAVFMPKPADIILRIECSSEDRAALAWAAVVRAVERLGHGLSVRFLSPAFHYAIEQMGGWQKLCTTLTDAEVKWRGKDFTRFFEIGERVASWDHEPGKVHVPPYLAGWHEVNNRRGGHALSDVIDVATGKPLKDFRAALQEPWDPSGVVMKLVKGMKASALPEPDPSEGCHEESEGENEA